MTSIIPKLDQTDEDFKKQLSFKRRNGILDWNRIVNVDLEHIVRTQNVAELQGCVDNICYSDLQEPDFEMFSEDANIIQLIRLFQLTTEYLVGVQNHLFQSRNDLAKQYDIAMENQKKLIAAVEDKNAKIKALKKALKEATAVQVPEEVFRCDECSAAFSSEEYLQRHKERRHANTPVIDSDMIVRKILEGIQNESNNTYLKLKAELDAVQQVLHLLAEDINAGFDDTAQGIEELKGLYKHIDLRAVELRDEIQKLENTNIPAPITPVQMDIPKPKPVQPQMPKSPIKKESDIDKLRKVLKSRAELKHIWFHEFPFLKARYPAPAKDVLNDQVNSMRSVANKTDDIALEKMSAEIEREKFPIKAINTATDKMVSKYYVDEDNLQGKIDKAERKRDKAEDAVLKFNEEEFDKKKSSENQRLYNVQQELNQYADDNYNLNDNIGQNNQNQQNNQQYQNNQNYQNYDNNNNYRNIDDIDSSYRFNENSRNENSRNMSDYGGYNGGYQNNSHMNSSGSGSGNDNGNMSMSHNNTYNNGYGGNSGNGQYNNQYDMNNNPNTNPNNPYYNNYNNAMTPSNNTNPNSNNNNNFMNNNYNSNNNNNRGFNDLNVNQSYFPNDTMQPSPQNINTNTQGSQLFMSSSNSPDSNLNSNPQFSMTAPLGNRNSNSFSNQDIPNINSTNSNDGYSNFSNYNKNMNMNNNNLNNNDYDRPNPISYMQSLPPTHTNDYNNKQQHLPPPYQTQSFSQPNHNPYNNTNQSYHVGPGVSQTPTNNR